MSKGQIAFQIEAMDNVATGLEDLAPGCVRLIGNAPKSSVTAVEAIPKGHKVALSAIAQGEAVVKYGVRIGIASRAIGQGEWVHLHNIHSAVDRRSSHLDAITGAPMDTRYE